MAAGWYPDPAGPGQLRWWDGWAWTAATRPFAPARPPIGPSPPSASADLDAERGAGRTAAGAVVAGAVVYAGQYVAGALLFGRVIRAVRDSFSSTGDGPGAPPVPPHVAVVSATLAQVAEVALLVVGVLFLIWFQRAATLAHRAGLPSRRSPNWAAVGFLVPVVNLWFPYRSALDLFPPDHPDRRLVGRWWALWLVTSSAGLPVAAAAAVSMPAALGAAAVAAAVAALAARAARRLIVAVGAAHAALVPGSPSLPVGGSEW